MPVSLRWALLVVLAAACLHPVVAPTVALAMGLVLGLGGLTPDARRVTRLSGQMMRACIVLIGFGFGIDVVLREGSAGILLTAGTIALTVALGLWLGRRLGVADDASVLVCGGTAICGGSAIAALSPAIGARGEATAVALGAVFVLNGVALFLFPLLGRAAGLDAGQFGAWAALAIHDTSSVVGAAAAYNPAAVPVATVLKLTRALWIVPLVLAMVGWRRARAPRDSAMDASAVGGDASPVGVQAGVGALRRAVPVFIVLFVAASALRSLVPSGETVFDALALGGRRGLVVTLLLVGAGLTRETLQAVGVRPLLHAALLWAAASALALLLVMTGIV